MKKDEPKILSRLSKDPGFKVPDNYFKDFAAKMTESLPEKVYIADPAPTLWHRMRPWVYMAAMFAGIWCMMKVFTTMRDNSPTSLNPAIAEAFNHESFVDEFVMTNNFDEFELLQDLCEDSVDIASAIYTDSIK